MTFLSYEGDETEIKELVADFCESLLARGFANDVEDSSAQLKSLIIVKENTEVLEMSPEVFFQSELEDSLITVIPSKVPAEEFDPEYDKHVTEQGVVPTAEEIAELEREHEDNNA